MMVGFVWLRDFNDGRFCSVTRVQRKSVSFHYEISETVGFVSLQDFKDGRFVPLRNFNDGRFCSVMRFQ